MIKVTLMGALLLAGALSTPATAWTVRGPAWTVRGDEICASMTNGDRLVIQNLIFTKGPGERCEMHHLADDAELRSGSAR